MFIPRSDDVPEGYVCVMALVKRHRKAERCDGVVIDTRGLEKLVPIVQLPFHMEDKVHQNCIRTKASGGY